LPASLKGATRFELAAERANLEARHLALRQQAKAYNDTYGGQDFPENDPRAKEGQDEEARLDQAKSDYVRDANAFNALIRAVQAGGGIGNTSGEFSVVTPDGRTLNGPEAAAAPAVPGTQVITGHNGHVDLLLADGTALRLGPDSNFLLEKDPTAAPEGLIARITQGLLHLTTDETPLAREIRVSLPEVIMTVRGTELEAKVDPSGAGYVKLISGKLEIGVKNTGKVFTMTGGQSVTFDAQGNFSRPATLDGSNAQSTGKP
jgi:FecR protein